MIRTISGGVLALLAVVTLAATAFAGTTTIKVTANGEGGWQLNSDPSNVTPYDFSTAEASLEDGSLHIAPITNTINGNADKFTAGLVLGTPVADLATVSYDFLIA
ncbi:MAG: hypothetical protein ACC652_14880, partial [Acidimicrobiales bacterium]